MPYRRVIFTNNEVYHILNRGVAGFPIFHLMKEYQRFLDLINFYRFSDFPLSFSHYSRLSLEEKVRIKKNVKEVQVEILAFCLMPTHFHLLLRQTREGGIAKMLSRVQDGYVRYFNLRNDRRGPLFESIFKAIRMETEEQLIHVSRYIHLNPTTSSLVKIEDLSSYIWSSFPVYIYSQRNEIVNSQLILKLTGGQESYKKFVFDQAEYQKELSRIKHLLLENP